LDLNQGPSGYEPVSQAKAEYNKIKKNINIFMRYEFLGLLLFMLF
jgi:hypothetical protein